MRSESMVGVLAMAVAVACAGGSSAFGGSGCPTVIHVPKQAASIDAAIAQACPGVPLEVVVAPGTWTMEIDTGDPLIDITIRGVDKETTIITGGKPGTLLNARYGSAVLLKHLTLSNAVQSGSTVEDLAWDLSFDDCIVEGCVGAFLFGAPASRPAASKTRFENCVGSSYAVLYLESHDVSNCEFVDCARPVISWGTSEITDSTFIGSSGYAVQTRSNLTVARCSFQQSVGHAVVGIANQPITGTIVDSQFVGGSDSAIVDTYFNPATVSDAAGSWNIVGSTFIDNTTATKGGAIRVGINRAVTLADCQFLGNTAAEPGGAFAQEFGGYAQRLEADGCTFIGNSSTGSVGGALSVVGWYGIMELSGCTFRENTALASGAIVLDRTVMVVEDCVFEDNAATKVFAGAISTLIARPGSVIRRTNFIENSAATSAGALHLYSYSHVDLEDCVFRGNSSVSSGGAVVSDLACEVDITRCHFEGNTALSGSAVVGSGPNFVLAMSDCSVAGEINSSAEQHPVLADEQGLTVATTTFCASGAEPLSALVADAGGNCISEYCTDFDANGVPDACECATNPALPSCCMGDLFNDGAVNAADLAVVLTQWGETGVGLEADLDGNGIVNGIDLAIVLSNWGVCD